MTCSSCVAKVKSELLKIGDIISADVKLQAPEATVTMQKHIPTSVLQQAIGKAGHYTISESNGTAHSHHVNDEAAVSSTNSYFPIYLIFAYITALTVIIQVVQNQFNWMEWMRHFMAGFFLVFSFFKLLDLKGFSDSYSTYDVIAKKWKGWGFIYPFVELALGIAFLTGFNLLLTNGVTFVVMSISLLGVLKSVFEKKKIKCACLGAVFNLPVSTITIIEDALMIVMSAIMLITLI